MKRCKNSNTCVIWIKRFEIGGNSSKSKSLPKCFFFYLKITICTIAVRQITMANTKHLETVTIYTYHHEKNGIINKSPIFYSYTVTLSITSIVYLDTCRDKCKLNPQIYIRSIEFYFVIKFMDPLSLLPICLITRSFLFTIYCASLPNVSISRHFLKYIRQRQDSLPGYAFHCPVGFCHICVAYRCFMNLESEVFFSFSEGNILRMTFFQVWLLQNVLWFFALSPLLSPLLL